MTIVFVSNFFNHHQMPLADCLYSLCNGSYYFVETCDIPQERLRSGYKKIDRPYLLKAWESPEKEAQALELSIISDILICSSELSSLQYKKKRLAKGKLTFDYSERPLKRGFLNIFSKTNIVNQFLYHTLYYRKPFYKLCAGGYVANDEYAMRSFMGKCYKFGYFLKIEKIDIEKLIEKRPSQTKILWCSRFIKLKHPEMVLELANRLRDKGFIFEINMIGTGPLVEKIRKQILKMNLGNVIRIIGAVPNEIVLKKMREHHILIFTSNKIEGWGAVINEAMANGCCVVSSDAVGSVPFLIKDGVNGRLFKSCDNDSLFECISNLIEHPHLQEKLIKEAYRTISEVWSPYHAATNFIQLCDDLLNDRECSISEGPCSPAEPIVLK